MRSWEGRCACFRDSEPNVKDASPMSGVPTSASPASDMDDRVRACEEVGERREEAERRENVSVGERVGNVDGNAEGGER